MTLTDSEVKALILDHVADSSVPTKGTEVAAGVGMQARGALKHDQLIQCLNELVRDGELVELEYIVPDMPERVKSLYFPKGTTLRQGNGQW